MIHRILFLLILVPLAILLVALAAANRTPSPFTVDPFNPGNPELTVILPLFVWLFAALAIGILIGSAATWMRQGRYRRAARERQRRDGQRGSAGNAAPAGTGGTTGLPARS